MSRVLGPQMLHYADNLLPVMISHILNPSSSYKKQETALKALGKFVSSTGLVMRPYLQYPQLLPQSLRLLCHPSESQPASLRTELLRTLGLLGALEPTKFALLVDYLEQRGKAAGRKSAEKDDKLLENVRRREDKRDPLDDEIHVRSNSEIQESLDVSNGKGRTNSALPRSSKMVIPDLVEADSNSILIGDDSEEPAHRFMYEQSFSKSLQEPPEISPRYTPSSDDYYPKVSIAALVKVLQDSSASVSIYHSAATNTIIKIFRTMGVKCVPFLEQIVPYFLQVTLTLSP